MFGNHVGDGYVHRDMYINRPVDVLFNLKLVEVGRQ